MSTSKKLCQPVTLIKNGKTCNEKNSITDRHIKRHDSSKKKVKSIIKPSQVPRHHQTQKGTTAFQICENSNNVW